MGLYLPVKAVGGSMAIAICPRCSLKMYVGEMQKDPNNGNFYHKHCVDIYDPYRLPARRADDLSVPHPRPDVRLT